MTTFASCDAPLELGEYHGCCIFTPRHGGSHFDGLYYWETGRPFDPQEAGAGRPRCSVWSSAAVVAALSWSWSFLRAEAGRGLRRRGRPHHYR